MGHWQFDRPPDGVLPNLEILAEDILYEFDEPLLFRANIGIMDCIVNKITEYEDASYYIACETDEQIIDALKLGKISVRGAFRSESYLIFSLRKDGSLGSFWRVEHQDVPRKYLPEPGVPLYHWMPAAPDTLAQSSAIFSVKFSSTYLHSESIALGKLKSLVDKSFSTVRALLTPPELRDSTSSTLDFECKIALSSFVVAVQSPIVNMRSIGGQKKYRALNKEIIEKSVVEQSSILAEKIDELANAVHKKEGLNDFAADNLFLVATLSDILPGEDGFLESVEFSSFYDGVTRRILFSKEDSAAVQSANREIENRPVTDRGKIIGGSESAHTLRILSFRGKKVTCHFSRELFELIAPENKIDLKRYVKVKGILERRRRVDRMTVQEAEFIDPRNLAG